MSEMDKRDAEGVGNVMAPMGVETTSSSTDQQRATSDVYIDYYTSCIYKMAPFLALIALLVVIINGSTNILGRNNNNDKGGSTIEEDGTIVSQREREHLKEIEHWHYKDENDHYVDKPILEFLEWETQSVRGIVDVPEQVSPSVEAARTCSPPNGIPTKCCIGSYTTHLKIIDSNRQHCGNVGSDAYQHIYDSIQDYTETNKTAVACDICRIVDLVSSLDLTVSFVGDGMSMQMFYGLACEFYRRNYDTEEKAMHYIECQNTPEGLCPMKHRQIQVKTKHGIGIFKFFFQDDASLDDPERDEIIIANADVLILNFGLTWEHEDRIAHMAKVEDLFKTIVEYRKHENLLIAFREPSAQHFDATGGDRSFLDGASKECTPLGDQEVEVAKWRDQTVKDGAKATNFKLIELDPQTKHYPRLKHKHQDEELVVLPFFDFTKPFYTMHPTHNQGADCHHFCSSPYFYVPIWRSLRLAVDRQYFAGRLGHPDHHQHHKKGLFGS